MNGEDRDRGTALARQDEPTDLLSIQDVRRQLYAVQQLKQEIMVKDEDYGIIPGCKKPSLWQPGAEKLCLAFKLVAKFSGEREPIDLGNGHREYVIKCELFTLDGRSLGDGFGSCSTMEGKYRYRGGIKESTGKPVPKEYWNLRDQNPAEAQKLIGGPGFGTMKGDTGGWEVCELGAKMENPDIADCWNTILQLARKRAFVGTVKTRTAASNFFTMDIDNRDEDPQAETHEVPPMQMPQEKATAKPAAAAPSSPAAAKAPGGPPANDKQKNYIKKLCKEVGLEDDAQRHAVTAQLCGGKTSTNDLNIGEASLLIDALLSVKNNKAELIFKPDGTPVIEMPK